MNRINQHFASSDQAPRASSASSGEKRDSNSGEAKGASALFEEGAALLKLRLARVDLAAREGAHYLLLGLVLALFAVIVVGFGAAQFVLGLTGALTELFGGQPWAGQLATGCLIFAAAFGGILIQQARMRSKFLDNLKDNFGADEGDSPSQSGVTP